MQSVRSPSSYDWHWLQLSGKDPEKLLGKGSFYIVDII
jgi:hypothetical protein